MLHKRDIVINNDNGKALPAEDACQLFNQYFTSVPQNIISEMTSIGGSSCNLEFPSECKNTLFLTPVNEDEIKRHIRKLKNKYSTGHDGISCSLLKQVANQSPVATFGIPYQSFVCEWEISRSTKDCESCPSV